ncbi:hypothetical protein M427DRAFT_257732 [Gonapodya prolifera JEL478]|uniref:Uncharacterized protein n=1 Tax=Gonapodya prolifera (strain JEL478) TaxID=1344416 RepID=A0A138ZX28_GONPJ|nr:hypothetical protein M427DRAFT_257732 [Gonapodya prolifera JEL478]|eukprot:KXS09047.1 hypothetical protein M427DRAFT_257732 [Gonapodya prolifera JEL478]
MSMDMSVTPLLETGGPPAPPRGSRPCPHPRGVTPSPSLITITLSPSAMLPSSALAIATAFETFATLALSRA